MMGAGIRLRIYSEEGDTAAAVLSPIRAIGLSAAGESARSRRVS